MYMIAAPLGRRRKYHATPLSKRSQYKYTKKSYRVRNWQVYERVTAIRVATKPGIPVQKSRSSIARELNLDPLDFGLRNAPFGSPPRPPQGRIFFKN